MSNKSIFKVEDGYISHNLIKENCIGYREYQKQISEIASSESSLIALPTAAGKTIIAAMIAAERLNSVEGKVLFLAPNKPLVTQQAEEFAEVLDVFEEDIKEMTGEVRPDDREEEWNNGTARILFATPQVIENDILSNRVDLTDISQIIFDECHRATGGYAYTFIAEEYNKIQSNDRKLVTGLSASPGSSEEDILQLCKTLGVTNVEIFSSEDELLKEHIVTPEIIPRKIDIDEEILEMRDLLQEASKDCYKQLKQKDYLDSARKNLSFGELNQARGKIQNDMDKGKSDAYEAMSVHAEAMKLYQAVKIIDTQGVSSLIKYLDRQFEDSKSSDSSKAVKRMCRRSEVKEAYDLANDYDRVHPKKTVLRTHLIDTVMEDGQVILFTEYTDTADDLVEFVNSHSGITAKKFVGQQQMKQSEQQQVLGEFRNEEFDVLVATSVGEEGLDIPAASMVVFYEPVSSGLRSIQRRGRTAREGEGKVVILIGKGTRDEGKYYASKSKEDTMRDELSDLAQQEDSIQQLIEEKLETSTEKQETLDGFSSEEQETDTEKIQQDIESAKEITESESDTDSETPTINSESDEIEVVADSRETKSNVVRELYDMEGITVTPETIEVGDFIAGPNTVIERKETSDLVSTITGDRDIFEQIQNMVNSYERSILLIEGSVSELYSKGVHPNAIRGLLDSVSDSFDVDIFYTTGEEDTARWIKMISKRSQENTDSEVSAHGNKKTKTRSEQQKYIVSSIGDIGPVTAKNLLYHFGTVENVFVASVSDLKEVDGVGDKTAKKIKSILTTEYSEED